MYNQTNNHFDKFVQTRSDPAVNAVNLTPADVSNENDLSVYPKALRVYNGSANPIVIVVTPVFADRDDAKVSHTIAAGGTERIDMGVRRIWSDGSTGLVAGLTLGSVEVVLYTE